MFANLPSCQIVSVCEVWHHPQLKQTNPCLSINNPADIEIIWTLNKEGVCLSYKGYL